MADKKMTQVEALQNAIDVLEGDGFEEMVETVEVLRHMVEVRKNRSNKPRKVDPAKVEFRQYIVGVLADAEAPMTNAEITATVTASGVYGEVKPQKIANNIRVLENEGVVVRHRGEKASIKDTFSLAV